MSPNSYYYYKKKFEVSILKDYIINKPKIGGPGKEVQIDESLFNRRKYNKGRFKKPLWVFGGVEVGTNRCFFYEVESRNKDTLQPLIDLNINKGSDVVSDMWRAYIGLENKGFNHYTVNHKYNFVNPMTGKHTQLIEGLWNLAKKKIHHDFGINRQCVQKYLDTYAWKKTLKKKLYLFY
ncbi:hypothetical protein DMUE_4699 [Dictyocoela muelleri]|nr:hypothetical protein DMUE_4699 [Dictyocoela muelleri]